MYSTRSLVVRHIFPFRQRQFKQNRPHAEQQMIAFQMNRHSHNTVIHCHFALLYCILLLHRCLLCDKATQAFAGFSSSAPKPDELTCYLNCLHRLLPQLCSILTYWGAHLTGFISQISQHQPDTIFSIWLQFNRFRQLWMIYQENDIMCQFYFFYLTHKCSQNIIIEMANSVIKSHRRSSVI